jgi:DNA-directed RNA polymerase subunit RPC12/RpoP
MTRISSYRIYQCSSCGQKHIAPASGSINFVVSGPNAKLFPNKDDLKVCQRCSSQKPLKNFIPLGIIDVPPIDTTPKWYIGIRKRLSKNYKGPKPHPCRLYPDLASTPFNPNEYYPDWIRKNMVETDYPDWYVDLSRLK